MDLYQVHAPYGFSSGAAGRNEMADLVEAGKMRAVGVSNFNAGRMRLAALTLQSRNQVSPSIQVEYSR